MGSVTRHLSAWLAVAAALCVVPAAAGAGEHGSSYREIRALVTRVLDQAGIIGYRLAPATSGARRAVRWALPGGAFGSLVPLAGGGDGIELDGLVDHVISRDRKKCEGDFLGGARQNASVGMRKATTQCATSAVTVHINYAFVQSAGGILYIYQTVGNDNVDGEGWSVAERAEAAFIATVRGAPR